jgi:phytol kinase
MSSIAVERNVIGKSEIRTEIIRKSIHMLVALVPLLAALNLELTVFILAGGILFYTWAETQRVQGRRVAVVSFLTTAASRRRDGDGIVFGPVTLGIGAMLALLLYPQPAAAMAIYALAFGDGLSGLFGKLYGILEIPFTGGKTIAGSLACFVSVLLIAMGILPAFPAAMAVAAAATLLEMLPSQDMDNIILPVGVGLITWYLMI